MTLQPETQWRIQGWGTNQSFFNYRPQRSWGKVMFLQASVILLTGGGVCLVLGGLLRGGAWSWGVSALGGAWWRPPGTATAAGGTHPTGMHSCFIGLSENLKTILYRRSLLRQILVPPPKPFTLFNSFARVLFKILSFQAKSKMVSLCWRLFQHIEGIYWNKLSRLGVCLQDEWFGCK